VAELRPWVFCGRMFPMVSLFATELVGVVRIMVGLDGTGNILFEFELRSLH